MAWTVTIDNGSTFTDGCLLADGRFHAVKVLTTPYDLMRCFVDVFRGLARSAGLENEGELLRRLEEVRYATTSGTNALLVRKGVRVGVVAGAEGVKDLYGLCSKEDDLISALVGDRIVAISPGKDDFEPSAMAGIRTLLARGAQWIVVSLPETWGAAGERDFKLAHMRLLPAHLLGSVPVLFSRELCADPDDARRTATAVLNGFLHREMARFLYHAEGWVREHHAAQPLRIMRNDGACGRVAKTTAVKTLDSGPMGGLAGVGALARMAKESRLVTVDVGGTSADIGIVEDGRPAVDLFGSVHGLPLSFSFPTLRTAALGGGSVIRVEGGKIRIGPDSAGALPGPACFGRGGLDPTLTDAVLVAGLLDAERFADGAIKLRVDLAESALKDRVAQPLGLADAKAGAAAVIEAFARGLAAEIEASLTRRDWKRADAALVAFGGSGPLLACMVAERLDIERVIIPPASSSFSALGVGFAELAHEYRALLSMPVAADGWRQTVNGMRERAVRDMFGEGISGDGCQATLRVRDEKTAAEIEVTADAEALPALGNGRGRVTLDYRSTVPQTGLAAFPRGERAAGKAGGARERAVLVGKESRTVAVIDAASFAVGDRGEGPCVLETLYWSALVPSGWRFEETDAGLRLERGRETR